MRTSRRKVLLRAGLGLFAVAVLLQLVPYGRDHTNPPVTQDAPWPGGRARELATAACYDCHSNQTRWPPQSFVAPFSWLLARDVEQGREALNFSTWDEDDGEADDAADAVADAEMPPRRYVLAHPDAALSEAERQVLVEALEAMDRDRGAATAAAPAAVSGGGSRPGRPGARPGTRPSGWPAPGTGWRGGGRRRRR
jgi:Haem-binding domain